MNQRVTSPSRFGLLAGGIVALSLGALDVWAALLTSSAARTPLPVLLSSLGALVLFTFLIFQVLWWIAHWIPALKADRAWRLMTALSLGVLVFVGLGQLSELLPAAIHASSGSGRLESVRFLGVLIPSGLISISCYLALGREATRGRGGRALFAAAGTLPIAWLAGVYVLWNRFFAMGSTGSVHPALGILAAVVVSVAALLYFAHRIARRDATLSISAILILIVIGGLLSAVPRGGRDDLPRGLSIPGAPRHVLFILIDTLRQDALSCYGSERIQTPHIDQLAGEAVRFTDAVSPAPWTLSAMSSIMTGLSPLVHGVRDTSIPLPNGIPTLAEGMRERGYVTGAIGSNPTLAPGSRLNRGFDSYDWFPRPKLEERLIGASLLRAFFSHRWQSDLTTTEITDRGIDWYRSHGQENTFLWLHYFDPHIPYEPPGAFRPGGTPPPGLTEITVRRARLGRHVGRTQREREWIRDLYLGEVRYVDREVGRLIDALKEMGLYDDMVIVLTSDHGEEFWDHDGFEHGHTLYRELLSVPLMIKAPHADTPGVIDQLVSTEAILPTLFDFCGVAFERDVLTGKSLAGIWDASFPAVTDEPILSTMMLYFDDRVALTTPDLKYIRSSVTGRELLFDRRTDRGEQVELVRSRPEARQAIISLLDGQLAGEAKRRPLYVKEGEELPALDESMIGRLRSLGYVD